MNSMKDFLEQLSQKIKIKKAIYFLYSMGMPYYEVCQREEFLMQNGYRDVISPALKEIQESVQNYSLTKEEITQYLWDKEPHLAYLSEQTSLGIEFILLCFLQKDYSIGAHEIFSVPLEELPKAADEKYGIVLLDEKSSVNHQGVFLGSKFYYYNPLYGNRRDAKEPPPLIRLLVEQKERENSVSLRLDNTIGVPIDYYKPIMRHFSEVFQGREINLDDIQFPFHPGNSEYFCVYNPETMKKIQFKISHRKDSEHWIEVEELWDIHDNDDQSLFITKYLHSIYNPLTENFVHIDGSFNFYFREKYKVRIKQQINAHADLHVKQWLVEGEISVTDWARLIVHFFKDDDLILDAFKGRLVEEVFEE